MFKDALQEMLEAELELELGYSKGDKKISILKIHLLGTVWSEPILVYDLGTVKIIEIFLK
ncbi:hypothetical protein [Abyssisolibacter fermentans]|uniref:hypothetical protein n=1 Tax=Abyssisolibacter fermentans TaxID=1766203 RepID=UPI00082B597F|nr:hypothetical protein [Abyssisolibacter fermentans]